MAHHNNALVAVDKFEWFAAIYREPTFTPGQKAVLGFIGIRSARTGQGTFCVKQSTLADPEHTGISEDTICGAIKAAKHLGYLVVHRERSRGNGYRHADTLRLHLPAKTRNSRVNSEQNPPDSGLSASEPGICGDLTRNLRVSEPGISGLGSPENVASDQRKPGNNGSTPIGLLKDYKKKERSSTPTTPVNAGAPHGMTRRAKTNYAHSQNHYQATQPPDDQRTLCGACGTELKPAEINDGQCNTCAQLTATLRTTNHNRRHA